MLAPECESCAAVQERESFDRLRDDFGRKMRNLVSELAAIASRTLGSMEYCPSLIGAFFKAQSSRAMISRCSLRIANQSRDRVRPARSLVISVLP